MDDLKEQFGLFYDSNLEKVYRFIFFKVNSQEVAEDLTSEAFTRCWDSFQQKSGFVANPSAFVFKIARNLLVDFYRHKDRTKTVDIDLFPIAGTEDIEKNFIINADLAEMTLVLSQMKDDYREAITLRFVEDLPIAEIAKISEKSEGAVRVLIHRALKELKSRIKEA